MASVRVGAEVATAKNLRSHLLAALATPLAARVSRFDLFLGAARSMMRLRGSQRQLERVSRSIRHLFTCQPLLLTPLDGELVMVQRA